MSEFEVTDESVPEAAPVERPADIPDKFWNSAEGVVRIDALVKSYNELEHKLGAPRPDPLTEAQHEESMAAAVEPAPLDDHGPAAVPEAYSIVSPHPLIEVDPEIDARLIGAGLTQAQAQLVYDLAAERLLPVIHDALGQIEAQQQVERLQQHFGGADSWQHTARQLKAWASSHLTPEIHATLAASYDGVLALHQMMRASEPELLGADGTAAGDLSEDALAEMMRDPRYWRQRDPEFIARVTAGFKRLYAD